MPRAIRSWGIKILNDGLGASPTLTDITIESYGFWADELDSALMPVEYQSIFNGSLIRINGFSDVFLY